MRVQGLFLALFLSANATDVSVSDAGQHANTTVAVEKLGAAVKATNSTNATKVLGQKQVDNLLRRAFASAPVAHNTAKAEAAEAKVEAARKHAAEIHVQVTQAQAAANAQIKQALAKVNASAAVARAKAAKVGDQKKQKTEKSIEVVQTEIKDKEKELKVQSGLVDEKQKGDSAAKKENAELKAKADNLRKEMEVALELAKEKSDAFAKADKEEKAGEIKEKNLGAEASETQKFLKQTEAEEKKLNEKLANLRKERSEEDAPKKVAQKVQKATEKATPVNQPKKAKTANQAAAAVQTSKPASNVATASEKAPELDAAAVRKLLEENKRLKAEKEVLVSELKEKKSISEKATLKQKLKARLLNIDRHVHVVMKKKTTKK